MKIVVTKNLDSMQIFGQTFLGRVRFLMKLGTEANSNMLNLMVLFNFSALDRNIFFGEGKFGPKSQSCLR